MRGTKLIAAQGHRIVRYADDFHVLSQSGKAVKQAFTLTERLLGQRGLRLNRVKTRIVAPGEGFVFLGREMVAAPADVV